MKKIILLIIFTLSITLHFGNKGITVTSSQELRAQWACPTNTQGSGNSGSGGGFFSWLQGIGGSVVDAITNVANAISDFFSDGENGDDGEGFGNENENDGWVEPSGPPEELFNPMNDPWFQPPNFGQEEWDIMADLGSYYSFYASHFGGLMPPPPEKDCKGVLGGTAYRDNCGYCVGGTTGKVPCVCPTDADFKVTKEMLLLINPSGDKDKMDSVAKYINLYKRDTDFNINTRLRLAHLLAQITAETDGFTTLTESHHYSKKALLAKKKYFDSATVDTYVNCICLFDRWYCCGHLGLGNGNEASKDGSKYRGHGAIQLTGRGSYTKFTSYYQNKYNDHSVSFVDNPELLATNMKYAVLAALWEACHEKKLNTYADNDDVSSYSKAINLGSAKSKGTPNGMTKRKNNLIAAKKALCIN